MCINWRRPIKDTANRLAFGAGQHMSDVSAVLGSFCQKLDFGCSYRRYNQEPREFWQLVRDQWTTGIGRTPQVGRSAPAE
jgi:hypothetical protein